MSKVIDQPKQGTVRHTERNGRINAKRQRDSVNPNRRKMSVDVSATFEEVHEMNKKALQLLAKRI